MSAVMETTRSLVRPETPVRLRLWTALVLGAAAALLVATTAVMAQVQEQVRTIGREAAPQAATAADLYFALSDLDAELTRMLLTGDADALDGSRIDALGAYRERSRQVDADVQRLLAADRETVLELLDGLAVYRQWVGRTLTAQAGAPGQPPGRLPAQALGYYTQATNVLHLRLLPAAQRLRSASTLRLEQAYSAKRVTEVVGFVLAVLLGGALLALLINLQVWLSRRFRRTVNPALLAATALSLALVVGSVVTLAGQARRLATARDDSLRPYLELAQVRATGYDAAADTSRYLVSANLALYRTDFDRKARTLAEGDRLTTLAGPAAHERWLAYQLVHQRVVALAENDRIAEAVGALTGIRRGDAAFDFAYFDAAVESAASVRKQEFDAALGAAERSLTGWVAIPVGALGLVLVLVPVGVRRRLAEYR